jgi:hypothetical protein
LARPSGDAVTPSGEPFFCALTNSFIESGCADNFKFPTGGSAMADISPLLASDATTFHKAFSIQAKTPNAELFDANAAYLKTKKLKNADDL